MTARFEVYSDPEACFRFRLVGADGAVMLTSKAFENEDEAIAGVWSLREAAATGRIVDLSGSLPTAG